MNMDINKISKAILVIALIGAAAVFSFFYRMGQNDAKKLADFLIAYDKFDKAITDFSIPLLASNSEAPLAADDLERNADEALAELNIKASARISSLTKHDGEIMSITREIADLCGKELDTLKLFKGAVANKNADLEMLAKELTDITNKRQAKYALFRSLED